jgi:hypothetical protein
VNAACAIDQYLRSAGKDGLELEVVDERVDAFECPVVRKDDLKRLLEDEHRRAESGTPEAAKYLTNEDMLMVMGLK